MEEGTNEMTCPTRNGYGRAIPWGPSCTDRYEPIYEGDIEGQIRKEW